MSLNISITKISYEQTWPLRQKVMWPDQPLEYVKLDQDPEGIHFGLFVNGELTSIVSIFVSGEVVQFRKFATISGQQGKGYGSKLMGFLMDYLNTMSIDKVWCNARLDKTSFYEKFGLVKTQKKFSKGGVDFIIMKKDFYKVESQYI